MGNFVLGEPINFTIRDKEGNSIGECDSVTYDGSYIINKNANWYNDNLLPTFSFECNFELSPAGYNLVYDLKDNKDFQKLYKIWKLTKNKRIKKKLEKRIRKELSLYESKKYMEVILTKNLIK